MRMTMDEAFEGLKVASDKIMQLSGPFDSMPLFMYIISIIVLALWFETFFWSLVLGRHSCYLRRKYNRRITDEGMARTAIIASVLAGAFSTCLMLLWVFFLVQDDSMHWPIRTFVFSGTFLSLIHFFVILAKCAALPRRFWPLLSQFISKCVLKRHYEYDILEKYKYCGTDKKYKKDDKCITTENDQKKI